MKREIKFRGWRIRTKDIGKIDNINFRERFIHFSDNSFGYEWDNVILMQFIGRKDKNGKEIFEGDIVINCNEIFEIVFTNGAFCLSNHKSPTIAYRHSPIGNYHGDNFEVIGNIYENPELLEEKNE